MAFIPCVPDQVGIAMASFCNIPAIDLIGPWFMMGYCVSGYEQIHYIYPPKQLIFHIVVKTLNAWDKSKGCLWQNRVFSPGRASFSVKWAFKLRVQVQK